MSTIKVDKIESTSTTAGGVTIDSSGNVQIGGHSLPTAGALGNRNLIINGDMRIAQRGTGAAGNGGFPVDRWIQANSSGVISGQQSTSITPDDFGYSFGLTVTTSDATIDASDQSNVQQHIEGYNTAQLLFGTANAKDVTVSFWVRGSVSGTYCMILLGSSDGSTLDRSYVSEYTINSVDTWEYKTITVPGDTGGTWHVGNGRGLTVRFGLTAGSNFQQAAGFWGTTNATGSANQTQLLATSNATWYVTGVQLEVGTIATPFEHRSYGQELTLCQRYYQDYSGTTVFGSCKALDATYANQKILPVVMRDTPTVAFTWPSGTGGNIAAVDAIGIRQSGLHSTNSFASTLTLDAEL